MELIWIGTSHYIAAVTGCAIGVLIMAVFQSGGRDDD